MSKRQLVMAKRGDQLSEHILWTAKDVFLEMGFERTSMDVIAVRAETSKRSLYAHFESKDKLFLAVIDLVRPLFLSKLKDPEDYSAKPVAALTLFCGRYLEILLYEGWIRMCRISTAEAERFPQGAAQIFELVFSEVEVRLAAYLKVTLMLSSKGSTQAAQQLLGQILYPQFPRALFGMYPLAKAFDYDGLSAEFDLAPLRKTVTKLIKSLTKV
jgi:AcrR family transcriptional regulator